MKYKHLTVDLFPQTSHGLSLMPCYAATPCFTPRLKQHSEACFVQDLLQDAEARLATVKASADEATPKAYVVGS